MESVGNNKTVNTQSAIDPDKSNSGNVNMVEASSDSTNSTNRCVICSTRNRALTLIPCGHFNVCVPCGHGLVKCPTCGINIKSLLRIYD